MDNDNVQRQSSLTVAATWLLAARTVSFVISTALPLFLVRHLNQVEFGLYKQAFLFVNTAVVIVPLGFGMSALYFLPREIDKRGQAVFNIVLFNLAVGSLVCLTLIARPSILQLIFHGPELVPYAPALGLVILLWTITSSFEIIAVACNEMKTAGAIIIFIQLTRTAFVLAAGILIGSVRSLIFAAMFQGVCQLAGLLFYLQARFPGFWRQFDSALMRRQFSYAMPLGAAGFLYILQVDLHNYFVSNRFGPAVYAVYAIGTVQLPLVSMLQEAATSVLIPRISFLQRNQESREIALLTARAIRKLAAAYLPLYALLLVVGREFIRFLFTDRYLSSWPVFAVNLTMLPIGLILSDPLYRAYVEQRYFLIKVRIVVLIASVLSLIFVIQRFGPIGVISVVVLGALTERIVAVIRFAHVLGLRWSDIGLVKDVGKIALLATGSALVTAIVRSHLLAAKPISILMVCGVVFAVIYFLGIFLAGVPSAEEKRLILDRLMPMLPASLRLRRTQP